ncbi:Pyridinium-3,5-bisthiocarboxylic acid mononucleotide nickel insertion protein [Eubacterium plexicaudatum ASF492]|nr:Pyridinium-3,5-bisthiocarboxylic acid mononucleotide nickel insertion protein [Eubacterium plexicaudatum ASF492]
MKKNRPAYQLNVLCKEEDILKLEQIIFEQTTTIGIRRQRMERSILPRTIETIQTIYGNIQVKICKLHGKNQIYPEYESIKRICRDTGCSYPEIYRQLVELCRKQFP